MTTASKLNILLSIILSTFLILILWMETALANGMLESGSMKKINYRISEIQREINCHNRDKLVVFDIDNTLIRSKSDLGSEAWEFWQKEQIRNHGKHKIALNVEDLYRLKRAILPFTRMVEIDFQARLFKRQMMSLKTHNIAVTSRVPQVQMITERQLTKFGYEFNNGVFKNQMHNFREKYQKNILFKNGIAYVTGQNKGRVINQIIKLFKLKTHCLFFIDDSPKNVKDVFNEFNKSDIHITTFRFSKEDARNTKFYEKDKEEVVNQWKDLQLLVKKIFDKSI